MPGAWEGWDPSVAAATCCTGMVVAMALLSLAKVALYPVRPAIIPGPLTTSLPGLSPEERARLPYEPDHYPGARDVDTPYGNIRVYEFGPEDGRKVLFLHGISTSCMTLTSVAKDMADEGCRVMLFDLFGRGFSDGVGDLPFDTRLFVTQILLVLASSPLPWTGDGALSLVGYSLGGGIAVNFAATFPRLVRSLVLLAPAGLIRPETFGRASRLVFTTGIIPERLLAFLTKRRLRTPIGNSVSRRRRPAADVTGPASAFDPSSTSSGKESIVDAAVQEAVDPNDADTKATGVHPLEAKVASYIHWALDCHDGFVPAFMSTVRHAPLMDQQWYWRKLATRPRGSTAVILGRADELIQHDDYAEDALPLLGGADNVFWRVVPGGHNFPFTNAAEALEAIYEFWDEEEE